jgi:ceramide glucosyltransferase
MWQNQLRWAQSTRYSRPKGHFGSGLIFALPYGLLGFLAAAPLQGGFEVLDALGVQKSRSA